MTHANTEDKASRALNGEPDATAWTDWHEGPVSQEVTSGLAQLAARDALVAAPYAALLGDAEINLTKLSACATYAQAMAAKVNRAVYARTDHERRALVEDARVMAQGLARDIERLL